MKYKNSNSNSNCAISDIKSRPMIAKDVKVQKINDFSKSDSVNQITYGTAED